MYSPLVLACCRWRCLAQEFRGAISGAVTDATGGTIAGAKVTVTETHTNTKIEAVTESTGQYTAPFLLPGDYDIAVKMAGFKEYVRKGVHVGAGEHPVIDIRLEVGDATLSVEVTAEAPLVNSENASVGHAITTKEVEDLPLNGGSPWMLSQLEIGVIYSPFNSTSSVRADLRFVEQLLASRARPRSRARCCSTARRTPPGTCAPPTRRPRTRCRKCAPRCSIPTPVSGTRAAAPSTW